MKGCLHKQRSQCLPCWLRTNVPISVNISRGFVARMLPALRDCKPVFRQHELEPCLRFCEEWQASHDVGFLPGYLSYAKLEWYVDRWFNRFQYLCELQQKPELLAFDCRSKRGLSAIQQVLFYLWSFPCGDWSFIFTVSRHHAMIFAVQLKGGPIILT